MRDTHNLFEIILSYLMTSEITYAGDNGGDVKYEGTGRSKL